MSALCAAGRATADLAASVTSGGPMVYRHRDLFAGPFDAKAAARAVGGGASPGTKLGGDVQKTAERMVAAGAVRVIARRPAALGDTVTWKLSGNARGPDGQPRRPLVHLGRRRPRDRGELHLPVLRQAPPDDRPVRARARAAATVSGPGEGGRDRSLTLNDNFHDCGVGGRGARTAARRAGAGRRIPMIRRPTPGPGLAPAASAAGRDERHGARRYAAPDTAPRFLHPPDRHPRNWSTGAPRWVGPASPRGCRWTSSASVDRASPGST